METRTYPVRQRRASSLAARLLILAWTLSGPAAQAAALAPWVPASPFGGRVSLVPAVDSPVVYAGAWPGGFYRSEDGGATWELRGGLADTIVPLAVDPDDPDHVLAARGAPLLESRDGGVSWRRRATPFTSTAAQIAFAPATPRMVWAAAANGLFRSSDGGGQWEAVGFSGSQVAALAFDPRSPEVMLAAVQGAADAGVWRTLDGGTTWTATPSFRNSTVIRRLIADPLRPGTFYALAAYNTTAAAAILFATPDRGAHWVACARSLQELTDVAVLPSGRLLAALTAPPLGVLRSDDGGLSWAPALAAPPSESRPRDQVLQLAPLGSGGVLAAGASGVWRSADGEGWRASSQGILAADPFAVTVGATGEVFASLDYALFRSDDHGRSWQQAALGGSYRSGLAAVADPVRAGVLYAPFPTLRSADRGRTWKDIAPPGLWCMGFLFCDNLLATFVIDRRDPDTIYLSGQSGLHNDDTWFLLRSRDGGGTWSSLAPSLDLVSSLAIDPKHSNILYGVVDQATLVKSVDYGDSWMPVVPGLPSSYARAWTLTIDPFDDHVLYAGSEGQGVMVSLDDGVHFRPMNEGLPAANASFIDLIADPIRPGHLYAGVAEEGVYRWTSAGRWEPINAGLPFATITPYLVRFRGAIALDPAADVLYAATAQGIFRLDSPDR